MKRTLRTRIFLIILSLFLFLGCTPAELVKAEEPTTKPAVTDPVTIVPVNTPLVIEASIPTDTVIAELPTATAETSFEILETPVETENVTTYHPEPESTELPTEEEDEESGEQEATVSSNEADIDPPYTVLELIHDGIKEKRNDKAVVDYSHIEDGYFMFRRLADTSHRYKVLVKAGGKTYQYNIDHGDWCSFPCSEGDGKYNIQVMENVSGTKYANVLSTSFQVKLLDAFSPFLRPNLNVNYVDAPNTMAKGAELTQGCTGPLEKVDKVYEFVTGNIYYDFILAATVQTGYTPDLDRVLSRKRGICYDYASLMTAMLRSQHVPTKLIFGYVGKIYHAWISVWVDEVGWVETIYFDGKSWQRMDPTFAAAGTSDESVSKYVGKGNNYAVKFSF